ARFVCSGEPPASYQRSSSCGWSRCQGHARDLHDPVSAFDQGDLNKERLTSPGKWFSHDHCACPVRTSFPLERYTLTHSSDPSFFPIDRILIRVRATVVVQIKIPLSAWLPIALKGRCSAIAHGIKDFPELMGHLGSPRWQPNMRRWKGSHAV